MADPALKLFGRTIQLADIGSGSDLDPVIYLGCENKDTCHENKPPEDRDTETAIPLETDQAEQHNTNQDHNTHQPEKSEKENPESCDAESQEKILKKPDKILPCPRCNSLDTKFCYYNNYNVNQPRHFCKNCQRYWTAGGTMRNVPVGAGRRKNKHSVPHFRPVIIPSESALDSSSPSHHLPSKPNGAVLKFESVLNLNEQMRKAEISANHEEPSCASSNATPMQYYAGLPWAFSWGIPPILGPPFCAPAIPLPFVPAPFWAPGPWTVPWAAPGGEGNGLISPRLGKHCRDETVISQEKKSLWVPKTLRIDDPDEAAKSSIWTTLGIKPEEGGMFKAYESKAKSEGHKVDASPPLSVNPAAFSRSQSFQEGV